MIRESLFSDARHVFDSAAVALYGAGAVGHDVTRVLNAAGVHVLGVIDRNARPGQECAGVTVYPLDLFPWGGRDRSQIPIVISIFNRDVDVRAIAEMLRERGFHKIVSFVDLHALLPDALGDRFWLGDRRLLDSESDAVEHTSRLWSDEKSRQVYRSLLALRRSGAYEAAIPPSDRDVQYLPNDVVGWRDFGAVRFVDCGAYRGDTLALFLLGGGPSCRLSALRTRFSKLSGAGGLCSVSARRSSRARAAVAVRRLG